jgi:hypothetical protein
VGVPDRRRDTRFKLLDLPEGTLTLFLDAVVQPHGKDEWIAISQAPAHIGETLMLEMVEDEQGNREPRERFPVCVIDCRPVVLDGEARYRIRLRVSDLAPVLFEPPIKRG